MRSLWLAAAFALGAGGTAHAQEQTPDPLEGWNRAVFSFNETIDRYALEPVAKGYRAVTPGFVRTGVSNALSNLAAPVTFANDVLQAAPGRAGTTVARFGINTTIGVAGLFDVASGMGLAKHSEDFGQTLGRWGVGSGPYLMLPLLGPSSVRDATGRVVDAAFDPLNYATFDGDDAARASRTALQVISGRESAIEAVDSLRATSIDPYVSLRSTYLMLRESAVRNGQTNVEDLPDFEPTPDDAGAAPPADDQPPKGN
jgi:phospholipid-binding lipoprotein MlaA